MINNHWYVGCASSRLPATAPVRTQIGDHNIVLFRDAEGRAAALLDRCCHRGFPLSHGAIKEGRLRCGYHGWEYDGTGQCVHIPSRHARRPIPRRYAVPRLSCVEQDSYVWIWIGEEQPSAPPRIPEVAIGTWLQGAMTIRCNYVRALEITFDMNHVPFVHPTHPATLRARTSGLVETMYELRPTKTGCVVVTPPAESADTSSAAADFAMEFRLPGTIRMERLAQGRVHQMFSYVTPIAGNSCRMDWLMTAAPDAEPRIQWHGEGVAVSGEDRAVLELVEPAYEREGEKFECSVEADAPTLTLRRIVRMAERGDWTDASLAMIPRRLLSIVTLPRR